MQKKTDASNLDRENNATKQNIIPESKQEMPLMANNFVWMAISILLIVLGFALMAGGSSGLDEFNPDIFSTRRIVVGPFISFIGFVLMAVAIIIKPKDRA